MCHLEFVRVRASAAVASPFSFFSRPRGRAPLPSRSAALSAGVISRLTPLQFSSASQRGLHLEAKHPFSADPGASLGIGGLRSRTRANEAPWQLPLTALNARATAPAAFCLSPAHPLVDRCRAPSSSDTLDPSPVLAHALCYAFARPPVAGALVPCLLGRPVRDTAARPGGWLRRPDVGRRRARAQAQCGAEPGRPAAGPARPARDEDLEPADVQEGAAHHPRLGLGWLHACE
jgi:hypothetical protein